RRPEQAAGRPAGAEPGARVARLERGVVAPDRADGAPPRARARARDRHELSRPRAQVTRVVNSRLRLLLLCILLVFAVLLARAGWLATVRASALSQMAQLQTKIPVVLPAGRGTIFDSMGTPLALGEQATTVYVDPNEIRKPRREATIAARVLGLKPGL